MSAGDEGVRSRVICICRQLVCWHDWQLVVEVEHDVGPRGPRLGLLHGRRVKKFRCNKCGAVNIKRTALRK